MRWPLSCTSTLPLRIRKAASAHKTSDRHLPGLCKKSDITHVVTMSDLTGPFETGMRNRDTRAVCTLLECRRTEAFSAAGHSVAILSVSPAHPREVICNCWISYCFWMSAYSRPDMQN